MIFQIKGNFPNGNNFRIRRDLPSALAAVMAVAGEVQALEKEHGNLKDLSISQPKESKGVVVGKTRTVKREKKTPATAAKKARANVVSR